MPELTPSVNMNASCRLPSSWKGDGILGPLTDAQIDEYARQGKYGPEMQTRAKARIEQVGRQCLDCKAWGARSMSYEYLPKVGPYCNKCRKKHRYAAGVVDEKKDALKERIQKAMLQYE